MSLVHKQSCECMKSELDLFAVPPTQANVETGHWIEHKPLHSIDDGTNIQFHIPGAGDDYIDLHNTYLYLKAQVLNADGTNIANGADVGPVNNWMHSLFGEVKMSLNDKIVTDSNNTYAYRAYIENLLNYGTSAKQSQLTTVGWYKDEAGHMESRTPAENTGFGTRQDFVEDSKIVDLAGRLHLDMCFQERYVLNGVDVNLVLVRNKPAFHLMANGDTFKVKLTDVALIVRTVKLSPSVGLAHAKALEKGSAKYPIRRVITKSFTVSRGSMSVNKENLFMGQMPKRVFAGLVDSDAFNGAVGKNPFNFKHKNVNFVALYLDGHQIPEVPFTPHFARGRYVRCFESLFSGTGKMHHDEGNNIDRSEYSKGYTLYGFDLTPDLSDGEHFHLIKRGNLRLEMKFSDALTESVNVVVYAEFDNVIEIDQNRNVIFDFNST